MADKPLSKLKWKTRLRKSYNQAQIDTRYQKYVDTFTRTDNHSDDSVNTQFGDPLAVDPSFQKRFDAIKNPRSWAKAFRQVVPHSDRTEVRIRTPYYKSTHNRGLMGTSGGDIELAYTESIVQIGGQKPVPKEASSQLTHDGYSDMSKSQLINLIEKRNEQREDRERKESSEEE